ncbi:MULTISPECIES: zinc ribbon domain-containing protein [Kosmotoga]|jgi:putative FmdB family regulatory protein|uniref:FmdB family zinc ribbon protein n=1 Tax=Kosmotoga TaxID=651456 RepID=UPI0009EEF541|nr:hypothetical protein [Kosmotoga sp.]
MPIYRFKCESCGKEETLLLKMNQEVPNCPHCGGKLVKQISRVRFVSGSSSLSGGSGSSCSGCSGGSCSSCG